MTRSLTSLRAPDIPIEVSAITRCDRLVIRSKAGAASSSIAGFLAILRSVSVYFKGTMWYMLHCVSQTASAMPTETAHASLSMPVLNNDNTANFGKCCKCDSVGVLRHNPARDKSVKERKLLGLLNTVKAQRCRKEENR